MIKILDNRGKNINEPTIKNIKKKLENISNKFKMTDKN